LKEGQRVGGRERGLEEGREGGIGRDMVWMGEGGRWRNRGIEMKGVGGSEGAREGERGWGEGRGGWRGEMNLMQYMMVQIYRFNRP